MSAMKWLTVIVLGTVAMSARAADSAAGRIFFTPEQRTQLDLLRKQKAIASQVRDEPVPETVTFNGIVRRNDGKTTVWLNNEALSESDLRNKQSIVGRIGKDGRVTLSAQQSAVELKVGQSATLFSGKVDESFTQRPAADKKKPQADSKSPSEPGIKPEARSATDAPQLEGAQKPPPR